MYKKALIPVFLIGVLSLAFCKRNSNYSKVNSPKVIEDELNIKKDSLDYIQGIWIGNQSLNLSIPYRVQNNRRVVDLVCFENVCTGPDDLSLVESYIGFLNNQPSPNLMPLLNKDSLRENGSSMVKITKQQGRVMIDSQYILSTTNYVTKLTSDLLYDEELYNSCDYIRINSLPSEIFENLKLKANKNNVDYIKEYDIYRLSSKIKVTSSKTYFHDEPSEDTKRRAYLLKGDIAYLEDEGGEWCKVYYDGKSSVTTGYVKRSDVEVIYPTQE